MNRKQVALVADIHLGIHSSNRSLWNSIALNWAEWLSNQLVEKQINKLWIAGDLFHVREEINVEILNLSFEVLGKFISKGIQLLIIPGNHDSYYKDHAKVNSLVVFKNKEGIRVIDEVTSENFYGKTVSFVPWGTLLNDIPITDIMVCHYDINGFKMSGNKVQEHGYTPMDLLGRSKSILTGHYHQKQYIEFSKGSVRYLGSAFSLDHGDCESTKGFYILDLETDQIEFFENTISPRYVKVFTNNLSLTDVKGNFVKLVVDSDVSFEAINKILIEITKEGSLSVITDDQRNIPVQLTQETNEIINISDHICETIETLDTPFKKELTAYTLEVYNRVK